MTEHAPDGYHFIYVAFVTLQNGKRIYARSMVSLLLFVIDPEHLRCQT